MGKRSNIVKYFWKIIYAHTIAYFIAGLFALIVVNYRDLFATEIIALVLLHLRKTFFEEKRGLLKLRIIIIGFSLLSTIGPTIGSFEGYIRLVQ